MESSLESLQPSLLSGSRGFCVLLFLSASKLVWIELFAGETLSLFSSYFEFTLDFIENIYLIYKTKRVKSSSSGFQETRWSHSW